MKNLDNIFNRIYCLSQEAASTVNNLRVYPEIVKNSNSYELYVLLEELHLSTLKVFTDLRLDLLKKDLNIHLAEILSKRPAIEKTYRAFVHRITLPSDHFLVRKLRVQINIILLAFSELDRASTEVKNYDSSDFMTLV